jgi:hypothetical protein
MPTLHPYGRDLAGFVLKKRNSEALALRFPGNAHFGAETQVPKPQLRPNGAPAEIIAGER